MYFLMYYYVIDFFSHCLFFSIIVKCFELMKVLCKFPVLLVFFTNEQWLHLQINFVFYSKEPETIYMIYLLHCLCLPNAIWKLLYPKDYRWLLVSESLQSYFIHSVPTNQSCRKLWRNWFLSRLGKVVFIFVTLPGFSSRKNGCFPVW